MDYTDFRLPNGNILRMNADGSARELDRETNEVVWPGNFSGVVEGNRLIVGGRVKVSGAQLRRLINERNRKRKRAQ